MSESILNGQAFHYRAAHADGRIEKGVVEAASQEAAVRVLSERGLWALEVRARRVRLVVPGTGKRAMPVAALALGLRILADFLEAGLPLARALATLEELAPAAWREALPAVREAVRQGKSLAAALGSSPAVIPPLVLGVVQAGEAGSELAAAVRRAADITEEAEATRAAIRGALAYPLILASAGTVSIGVLVGVVLPRFATILAELGQAVPPTTRFVLHIAELARAVWAPSFVILVIAAFAWRAWTSTDVGRREWHAFLLQLPAFGTTRRSAATARGTSALAALLASGVPISAALSHAARAMGDAALAARLLSARDGVLRGDRLSRALEENRAVTVTAIRLVRAGEESGRLAPMLAHAGRIEREEALRRTRGAVRLLEPGLIVAFGGIVALVAAALLQALYSVRPGS
jgi:general secretion pathway protein F